MGVIWGIPEEQLGKVTSLETRAAILDLIARYAWAQDTGDTHAVSALCTEDFEYISAKGLIRGRSGIVDMITTLRSTREGRGKQHWLTNSVFVGDGEFCFVRSMGAGPRVNADAPRVDFVGFHDDLFASVDGTWYFQRRIWRDWSEAVVLPPMNDASDLVTPHG